ncbi:MAG: site-specific integrase, partial [Aeromicrobium sp.]
WVSAMSKARGATTVQRALAVLSGILDESVKDRRLLASPAVGVKTPRKIKKPRTYLTHAQVHALAREAGGYASVVLVMAYCGLRWGEMAALRVKDVDITRRRLSVEQNAVEVGHKFIVGTPKSHERRTVPFPELLEAGLRQACEDRPPEALIFPSPDGSFMHNNTRGWFAGAVTRSGVPRLTPHDLRHTAASLAISAGANVKAVQRMLGHASAAMTLDTYADLFDDDLDAVAIALHAAATPFIS